MVLVANPRQRKYQKRKELESQPSEIENTSYVMCPEPICSGIFVSMVKLKVHIKYAHGIKSAGIRGQDMEPKSSENSNLNYFLCPQSTCDKMFDCIEKLNSHIQVTHVLKILRLENRY